MLGAGPSPLLQRDKSWSRTPAHLMEGFSLPATPSKAKPGRRGFCSFTTVLVVLALVAGVVMFSQDLGTGTSHTETYYRKALVAKMYFSNSGQTVTATSEEYSRSTVAHASGGKAQGGAAKERGEARSALELPDAGAALAADGEDDDEFGELAEGDEADVEPRVVTTVKKSSGSSDPLTVTISATQQSKGATSDAKSLPQQQQQQQQAAPSGGPADVEPASTAGTEPKQQSAAEQQQQQQQRQGGAQAQPAAEPEGDAASLEEASNAWWSDIVSTSGQRVAKPPRKERDISASLATAVTFDESSVEEDPNCKIGVLDVDKRWGETYGAGNCDLSDEETWPFATVGRGIDGHSLLRPEQYQYSMEHWIAKAIRSSPRYSADPYAADFIFVDMNCYHAAWMAWLHPQNEAGRKDTPSPEYYITRSLSKIKGMTRFRNTKGGDFGMVHPAPMMKGLFSEEAACEDFASALNMVPERGSLCVWTQDSHQQGKSVLMPYVAVSDIDVDAPVVPAADRETLLFFQGGCGDPHPAARPTFAAGKMLRYELVQALKGLKQADIHAECACDICADHMPHEQLMARMTRSVFCPIVPSNTQSSRRLSEAMLTGCIPVFVGAPFHTLPLAADVDYASFALFVNVTDNADWINSTSPKWEHNHMITKAWKLDNPAAAASVVTVQRLADIVTLLRGMPAEEVAARHAGVVANRLKFWYPPASAEAIATSVAAAGAASAASAGIATSGALMRGGGGRARALADGSAAAEALQDELARAKAGQSVLGELLMRKMCHRAAAVRKRLAEAARQGLDFKDSDEKLEHPSLVAQAAADNAGKDGAQAGDVAEMPGDALQQYGNKAAQSGQEAEHAVQAAPSEVKAGKGARGKDSASKPAKVAVANAAAQRKGSKTARKRGRN